MKTYITETETGGLSPNTKISPIVRLGKPMFFIQFLSTGCWIYATPIVKAYGYETIEACQDMIDKLETQDELMGLDQVEWRIKEELV